MSAGAQMGDKNKTLASLAGFARNKGLAKDGN
jgi:hypothetical protein